jgi:hypothetical protein
LQKVRFSAAQIGYLALPESRVHGAERSTAGLQSSLHLFVAFSDHIEIVDDFPNPAHRLSDPFRK